MLQAVHGWSSTYERLVKSQKFFSSYLTQEDMSRLGRDYLKVGYYTEIAFPDADVRFIAINNGVDSASQTDSDSTPFLNIINEWYAKDTSKKVRAVFRSKGQAGKPPAIRIHQGSRRQTALDYRCRSSGDSTSHLQALHQWARPHTDCKGADQATDRKSCGAW